MSNDNLKETIRTILMRRAYDPWRVELEATEIAALVQPLVDERDALKMGMASASATLNNLWRAGDLTTGDVATRIEKAILSREDEIRTLGSSRDALEKEAERLGKVKSEEIAPLLEKFKQAFGVDIPQAPNVIYDLLRADVLAARSVLSKCDDYDANKSLSDAVTTVVAKYEERLSAARNAAAERTKEISQAQLVLDKNSTAPRGPLADRVMFAIGAKIAMIVELETELRGARSAIDAANAVLEKHRPAGPFLGSLAHRIEKIISARDATIAGLKKCQHYVYAQVGELMSLSDWLEKSDTVVSKMRELEQRAKVAEEKATAFADELETVRTMYKNQFEELKRVNAQAASLRETHATDRAKLIATLRESDEALLSTKTELAALKAKNESLRSLGLRQVDALSEELAAHSKTRSTVRLAVAEINKAVASLQTFPAAAFEAKPAAPKNVVVKVTHGDRILLVCHVDRGWELPGGAIKQGEDPFDAARRELREETGLNVGSFCNLRMLRDHESMVVDCNDLAYTSLAPNDPDGKIVNAKWMDRDNVAVTSGMGLLSDLPSKAVILQWAGL